MTPYSRRGFLASGGALALSACSQGTGSNPSQRINEEIRATLQEMYVALPFTEEYAERAAGLLVMPRVTKGSFFWGGSYGEGALLVNGVPVDYYNQVAASFGLQLGGRQYSSVLFLMTPERLKSFRERDGWTLGADLEFTAIEEGEQAGINTTTAEEDVFAVVFGQKGLLAGVSVEGAKYSRVLR